MGRPAVRYLSTLWSCSTLRHCRPAWASSQVVDAGSHLYSAQQDSVRSRTLSEESYGLSWVTPSPLRSLGLCSPSLISDLIIAHILRFVKTFFSPRGSPSSLSGGTVFHEPFQVLRGLTRTCVPASCGCPRSPLECLYYSTDFVLCQAFFLFFFWGSSLFVPLFIPPEGCSYFVNAESVLQRIFAIYNLAGVVSQSAAKRGGLM